MKKNDKSETVKFKSISELINSDVSLTYLSVLKRETGEAEVCIRIAVLINDLNEQINVDRKMNEKQILITSREIIQDYGWLSLEDLKLCFSMGEKGELGPNYGRLDIQIIYGWLREYVASRLQEADDKSYQEHIAVKEKTVS